MPLAARLAAAGMPHAPAVVVGPLGTDGAPPDPAMAVGHRLEDPLRLPILARDVRDAGPRRVAGTLAHALGDPSDHKLPRSGCRP
jgi:hypothetical protein